MGNLIKQDIPTLTNGVSEQAPSLRLRTQCEEQVNCRNSLVDGMGKRHNTWKVCSLGPMETEGGYFEFIKRDGNERYLLHIDNVGAVAMKDMVTGFAYPIEYSNAGKARAYLKAGVSTTAQKVIQTLTIADTTFMLNKTKPVMAQLNAPSKDLYIFSFASFPWRTVPDPETYWEFQIGSQPVRRIYLPDHVNSTPQSAWHAAQTSRPDHSEFFNLLAWVMAIDIQTEYGVAIHHQSYHNNALWTLAAPGTNIQHTDTSRVAYWAVSVAAYGGMGASVYKVVKDHVGTEMAFFDKNAGAVNNMEVTPQLVPAEYKLRREALVYIKQSDYAVKYEVTLNGTVCSYTTPDVTAAPILRSTIATDTVTNNLATQINNATATHGVTATVVANVIHLTCGTDFTLVVKDSICKFSISQGSGTFTNDVWQGSDRLFSDSQATGEVFPE